jgi:ribonuclease P protein component
LLAVALAGRRAIDGRVTALRRDDVARHMIERIVHKSDFESLLASPMWSRSAHFAIHHLAQRPQRPAGRAAKAISNELCTDLSASVFEDVDKSVTATIWAGAMVPKRHAKRAVTRNVLKRQMHQAFARHEPLLMPGLWLLRLKRGFATAEFKSARSARLADAARMELDALLQRSPAARGHRPVADRV